MGGNMYVHVEVRDSSQSEPLWTYVPGVFYDGHNPMIFALLAGVGKNDDGIEPLDDQRGLPWDVSSETCDIYYGESTDVLEPRERATSWFTLAELEDMVDWDRFIRVWHEIDFSIDTMSMLRRLAQGNSEVRIIFWFDDTFADIKGSEYYPFTFTPRG